MVTVVSQITNESNGYDIAGIWCFSAFDYLCLWRIFTDIVRYA